ncbi:MAG: division/cell wall cluster transcriptional repressor MraZ [Ignavibacteriales bacterium CG07_land_8_20_14_0_80_59_12]|nr:MAG: division/cell wall cluster transcriptional repressor MraZ [Ignavibacteriales bacterium CG07_land_8_20_14_0_80_59_12]
MSSFKGRYDYTVDNKGRLNIPVKIRKSLSPEANDTFILTRGYEQCLFLYPLDEWSKLETSIRDLPTADGQNRYFVRTLLQWTVEVQLDNQARVAIPQKLLEFARIESEVIVLGVLERVEIWNPAIYEAYMTSQSVSYEDVAATVLRPKS